MSADRIAWRGRCATLLAAGLGTVSVALARPKDDLRPDYRPAAFAIKDARIITGAGAAIEAGTVVVRDGVIEAVGPADKVQVPYDAEAIDGKGMVVYPGFIDLYTNLGVPPTATRSQTGPGRPIAYNEFALAQTPADNRHGLTPEFEVASVLEIPDATAEERRKLGFTDFVAAPGGAIATGQSALVSTSGLPRREAVLKAPLALHVNVRPPIEIAPFNPDDPPAVATRRLRQMGPQNYPVSHMGAVAHLRQAMLDSEHDYTAQLYFEKNGGPRPPFDPALRALHEARSRTLAVWWEANTRDEIHRALDLAAEFGTTAVIVSGHEAAKAAERLKALDVPVVLRLDFPEEPKVPTEAEFRKKEIEDRLEPLKVLADRNAKWKERVATARDLAKAGVRFAFASDGIAKVETFPAQVRKLIAAGLSADAAVDALTRRAAEIAGVGNRLGTIEPGKLGHLVVMTAPFAEDRSKVRYVFADGIKFDMEKSAKKKGADAKKEDAKGKPDVAKAATPDAPAPDAAKAKDDATKTKPEIAAAKSEEDQPSATPFVDVSTEFEADRKPTVKTGGNVLIKDVVILTASPAGTIPRGSILVRDGKIAALGPDVAAPVGTTIIDAAGMVAMPGIIDTHSHMGIQGNVNEMSLSIVPEVSVRDVVDGADPTIYRALAGGTTTARLLHGSANTIGGQDVIIKLRHGEPGRDLIVRDEKRPQGVKFALGENVTRRAGRFPNTRMGVEATIERAFDEARAYRARWDAYTAANAAGTALPPPRRDLRLEALARIVDGSYKIHSHCYRADEILMLLRVAERFGIRVQSLQHVLEGYKVAPEIAAHGASASTFSDWWAYKVEAADAIPYNAALLTEAGARVCIKSDSDELVRHLYLEAAKMVKYGGVTEAQALEMITMNPARELGLEHRVGSLEVGKDADIAIFNAHPFDSFARCELALIDGEVWFQRKSSDGKLAARPGDHSAMPAPGPDAKARVVEIATNPKGSYAIVGANLHPVAGADVPGGTLVIAGGRIAAIGGADTAVPPDAQTIDARGLDVYPGMVDGGSLLGLFEIGSLPETQDFAETGLFQPEVRTSTALHPDSRLIPVTRANGVLAAYVQPTGGSICGQGAVVDLNGWVPPEMVVVDRAALNVNIPAFVVPRPDAPPRPPGTPDPNSTRQERIDAIKEVFRRALAYDAIVTEARARKATPPIPDPRLTALVPYARGEKPVIFRADRTIEILDALKLAAELKLKAIISGGAEAWKVADRLKAARVPVLVAGTLRLPNEVADPYDAPYANPARLHEAGVTFAIRSIGQGPDQATSARNLPYEAATAVAYGLPEAEGLKAVTLAPAQILGVADQLGSLEVGKRANVVVTAGPLLQVTTEVKALFIGGKPVAAENSQTRLYAMYRQRLAEVRAGTAPLGLERHNKDTGPTVTPTPAATGASPVDRK
jgi:imidazolonepropionase-like amidohydrolase